VHLKALISKLVASKKGDPDHLGPIPASWRCLRLTWSRWPSTGANWRTLAVAG